MNCYYCQGIDTMEKRDTQFCVYDGPEPFVLESAPASVCRLCGDKSFSEEVVSALEKIKNGEVRAKGFRAFRVYDFRNLEQGEGGASDYGVHSEENPWIHKLRGVRLVEEHGRDYWPEASYFGKDQPRPMLATLFSPLEQANQPVFGAISQWTSAGYKQSGAKYGTSGVIQRSEIFMDVSTPTEEIVAVREATGFSRGYHDHLRAWQEMGRGRQRGK